MPLTVVLSISILAGVIAQNRPSLQSSRDLAECNQAYLYVKNSPSTRILSESLGPLLVAGKPVLVSDPFVFGQLIQHGLWPNKQPEELIEDRYFDLILTSREPSHAGPSDSTFWPESLRTAIDRNYQITNRFACRDANIVLEPIAPRPGR
jgi:hypothetical protein